MPYKKEIPVGDAGSVVLAEEGGVASVTVQMAKSVGQGSVADVVKTQLSASAELDALHLVDAGLAIAAEKFPAAAALINGAKAIIDAELAKA